MSAGSDAQSARSEQGDDREHQQTGRQGRGQPEEAGDADGALAGHGAVNPWSRQDPLPLVGEHQVDERLRARCAAPSRATIG